MIKHQRLFTNDQRLLKIYSFKGLRKNSYENFSLFEKTNPIFPVFRSKTMVSKKTNPILSSEAYGEGGSEDKMKAHAWKTNLTIIIIILLTDLTSLQGCFFLFIPMYFV